jgi:hypothetical protein
MNATRLNKLIACSSILSIAGWLGLAQIGLAGDNSEFQRTTAILPLDNIEVENLSPNTIRLELPPSMAPTSPTPVFFPLDSPNAHLSLPTLILPETVLPSTPPVTGKEVAWWDVRIKVTRPTSVPPDQDVMISIDKDILNTTPYHWTDFHMDLLREIDGTFQLSNEFDFLFFKDQPPPISSDDKFMNPPKKDDPAAADQLWWDWNPPANPGVKPGELARFWIGINVPSSMFVDNMATFVLREHATRVPEPTTLILMSAGLVGFALAVRRHRSPR